MQVYTSPVPAYLLSALPLHLLSIHIPHLWAHMLLSLCHFSVNKRNKNKLKFGPVVQYYLAFVKNKCELFKRQVRTLAVIRKLAAQVVYIKQACNAAALVTSQTSGWLSMQFSKHRQVHSTTCISKCKGEESTMLYENHKTCHVLIMQSAIMNTEQCWVMHLKVVEQSDLYPLCHSSATTDSFRFDRTVYKSGIFIRFGNFVFNIYEIYVKYYDFKLKQ